MKIKVLLFVVNFLCYCPIIAYPGTNNTTVEPVDEWTGTCVAIGTRLVATNYHVIEDAKDLVVTGYKGNKNVNYTTEVFLVDKYNDLAVLKINDPNFDGFTIKYGIKNAVSDIGTSIFVLGYPLTLTMGEDIKLTTGVISSKTGFQGDVSQYQISAPIQPGNSGGPLFDEQGNLIGIVSAKHRGAENVGYAIKLSYLKNLLDSSNEPISLNSRNTISTFSLPNKVKAITPCVLLVKASAPIKNTQPSASIFNTPTTTQLSQEDIVNINKAHDYMIANDENNAYEYYKKIDIRKLNHNCLNEFTRCSYFTGHFMDALRASEAGLILSPRNPTFVRLAMFSNYELKNYNAAKQYIYRFLNETDGAQFSEYDFFYISLIYQALSDKRNMYFYLLKAIEMTNGLSNDKCMIKRWTLLKQLSDCYLKDNDFENAIKYYEQYLMCKPELNFDDEEGLANIYSKYGDADEKKKKEMINKAIDIFGSLAQKYTLERAYAHFMRGGLYNKMDKNMEKGLAKTDYQKVIYLLENNSSRSKGENTMLITSYHYMMYYSFIKQDLDSSVEFAEKILEIDPTYKPANEIMQLLTDDE